MAHGGWLPRTVQVVSAVTATFALAACSWLPPDHGPPTIENAPLAQDAGWDDTCIVGTWRLTLGTTVANAGGDDIDVRTTGDRILKANVDGTLAIEYPGAGLVWHGDDGTNTLDATVTGTATGTYQVVMGRYTAVTDASAVFTTITINGTAEAPRAGLSQDQSTSAIFCADDELILQNDANRTVYARG